MELKLSRHVRGGDHMHDLCLIWKLACNMAIACASNTCIHLQVPAKAGPYASECPNAPDALREETPIAHCAREHEATNVSLNPTRKCRLPYNRKRGRWNRGRRRSGGRRRNSRGSTRAEVANRHLEPKQLQESCNLNELRGGQRECPYGSQ